MARGKGVILLCPHLTALHICGALYSQHLSFAVVYNHLKHPLFDHINRRHFQQCYSHLIARESIRSAIKLLRANEVVFYTPDIDPVYHGGVFAPFFGNDAYTLTATAKIAQLTGAAIIPVAFFRRPGNSGYDLTLLPPLTDFPSNNALQDASLINATLENIIRQHPEQYMWQYKRFKTRPVGEADFYATQANGSRSSR